MLHGADNINNPLHPTFDNILKYIESKIASSVATCFPQPTHCQHRIDYFTMNLPTILLSVLLVVTIAVTDGASVPSSWQCRMAPAAQHASCGLPYALSNFQG